MITEGIYFHYLNSLLEGDKSACKSIVEELLAEGESIKEIYLGLFQRSMYRIGQMWERERCSIADEHIATKITEALVDWSIEVSKCKNKKNKSVVIACIDKEYHELGAKMVAGYFEINGWNSTFLGSSTPLGEITRLIRKKQPDVVGISVNFYMNIPRLTKLVSMIKSDFPAQEIIVGGQALAGKDINNLTGYSDIKYLACLNQLDEYLSGR
ncbi:cobalamin B12-binding domain-containing protein [Melioribacter sp. Ez-97]|uniref:cobalamin B12-binding domain-containing protein n=1 Tax=Melioribacter sp. Ez-97 TaxID=3423434 RepID=UPI003ED9CB2E